MEHGKRYTIEQRKEILQFRNNHTFQETSEKFGVSMMTLFRWSQRYGSKRDESEFNKDKEAREERKMDMVTRYGNDLNNEEKAKAIELAKMVEVLKFIKDVKAIILVNDEGKLLTMVSIKEIQDAVLNEVLMAVLSVGDRVSNQLYLGNLETVLIKSKKGIFLAIGAGPSLVIVLILGDQTNLRYLFAEDFLVIERVKQALKENSQINSIN